jgi:tRNA pseudouridine38-40 synthase
MRWYRLNLEYDGTAFHGWAKQPGQRTVEGEMEQALATLLRHPARLRVAGRTDRGVHASGQVASFASASHVDLRRLQLGLNAVLPEDVAVRAVNEAPAGFDARAASARTYRYRVRLSPARPALDRLVVWHVHERLDAGVLKAAAAPFVGCRDWSALTPSAASYHNCVREVRAASWHCAPPPASALRTMLRASQPQGQDWVFEVAADSFLHMMVRVMVGSMVDAAAGRLTVEDLRAGITSGERRRMGRTAPACGLCLIAVEY